MRLNPDAVINARIGMNVSKMKMCRETGLIIPAYEKIESGDMPNIDDKTAGMIASLLGKELKELTIQ